jgi:hypothetical protein
MTPRRDGRSSGVPVGPPSEDGRWRSRAVTSTTVLSLFHAHGGLPCAGDRGGMLDAGDNADRAERFGPP